ncbi:flagellar protein FlaG [Glaciecola siphonariae]|uniref:Flagellar protein FlaG n=1 Tax=Glaciecola siphonariae TaxID=521012 RepID=A0ABV9LTU9_9ALTE
MDNINSQIGQNIAREQASIVNEKTFNSNNLVGMQTGVSQFTRSENAALTQQVRNLDKSVSQLPEQKRLEEEKKLKSQGLSADTLTREETVDLSDELDGVGAFLQSKGTAISFSVDEATERQVVTVKDAASGDVIRQIPSEEVLNFAERIRDLQSDVGTNKGVLINGQA